MRVYGDASKEYQLGFQEPVTSVSEGIMRFHNDVMIVLVFIVVFVIFILGRIILEYREDVSKESDKVVHGVMIEVIWTVTPALILMVIAVPSFTLLYAMDEVVEPSMTVKVIGRQWNWCYEIDDGEEGIEYESYMINEEDLEVGELRLLEVDNRLILPVEKHIRLIVTASDVMHSFAIPSAGVKIDCIPGRLNEVTMYMKREGVYYGQCSELCGVNHAFMPICVEVVSVDEYIRRIGERE